MRRIAASLVLTLAGKPLKNGVVTIDDKGKVISVTDTGGNLQESERTEFHNGILIPGFVNAHCHLEFSFLKNSVPRHTGIGGFIGEINRKRFASEEVIVRGALEADREMFRNGISAVGDITNASSTLQVKKESNISYYTFIETFGFHPSRASKSISQALEISRQFEEADLPSSVTPHAPYSVSDELFLEIRKLPAGKCSRVSIHNQESREEEQFFVTGEGPMREHMEKNLGIDTSHWRPTGKSSLASILHKLPEGSSLLLVHNTFINETDLTLLSQSRNPEETYLVLCPNSNLYIESQLPPVDLLRNSGMKICLGTDSLASNSGLSILQEMITLQLEFPMIPLEEMVTWACLNGARALGMDNRFGTIEPGKIPGLVLLTGVDLSTGRLRKESKAKRLI